MCRSATTATSRGEPLSCEAASVTAGDVTDRHSGAVTATQATATAAQTASAVPADNRARRAGRTVRTPGSDPLWRRGK